MKTHKTSRNITLTVLSAIFSQLVSVTVALVLPKLLILTYGSDFNGIVSTAQQFVTYLTMIDSGMYAAVCYQFIKAYKHNDVNLVNQLFTAVGVFFRKTSYIAFGGVVLVAIGYAMITKSNLPIWSIVYIIVMYSLGTLVAYFGYFKYNLVLFCEGKQYFITTVCALFSLVSMFAQWFIIKQGWSLYVLIAVHPICVLMRLIVLKYKTKKDQPQLHTIYPVNHHLIHQKWDSLVLNISDSMKTFAPIIGISCFLGAAYVSIYSIYLSVLHLGSSILVVVLNGLLPTLGKDLVVNNHKSRREFRVMTSFIFYISGIISVCFAANIRGFILLYLGKDTDISYSYPVLAFLMIISVWFLMVRTGYDLLIKANGFIKELRKSAVIEIILALGLCGFFAFFKYFQLILLGVLFSTAYRTTRMCWFCSVKMKYDKQNYLLKDELFWGGITTLAAMGCMYVLPVYDTLGHFVLMAGASWIIVTLCYTFIVHLRYPLLWRFLMFRKKRFLKYTSSSFRPM